MAETAPMKRQREETHIGEDVVVGEETKRHKSYNQILSLLETEEEEPTQDLSSLMSTLEHELISFDSTDFDPLLTFTFSETPTTTDPENPSSTTASASSEDFTVSDCSGSSSPVTSLKEEEEEDDDDKERVIRHLLEASDDELGIPQADAEVMISSYDGDQEDEINGGDHDQGLFFSVCDGLWELEDEAANYYTYLQSELFM